MAPILRDTQPIPSETPARRLVVVVHGWWANLPMFSIADIRQAIVESLPDADLMLPQYCSRFTANTDPVEVAESLSDAIELACDEKARSGAAYEEVILVGYSLGSLIVRKAFLIG
jgi:predicted esterase